MCTIGDRVILCKVLLFYAVISGDNVDVSYSHWAFNVTFQVFDNKHIIK